MPMSDKFNPTILHGEKVILRPFRTADAEPLWAGIHNKTLNKLTGTHGTFTRPMINAYVARQIANDDDDRASFVIALPDDERGLGEVIINDIDHDNHSANIRIGFFDLAHVNKGYGTDAMRLMVDYGFKHLNLHRIELTVYAFNPRAIRAYEKVGFKQEGILRHALYWEGEYIDGILMSILAHEWKYLSS